MNIMERASQPSRAQIECLLEFFEKNPSLAKGFSKVPSVRDAARRSWETLALQLNSLGGCVKTLKQWIKYWADKKSAVKKKGALRYSARKKTGGQTEAVDLTDLEEKILTLIGGKSFATGDRHLEINPFEMSGSTSHGVEQLEQTSEQRVSMLEPQLLLEMIPVTEDHQPRSSSRILSDTIISTRIFQNAVNVTASPPQTPLAGFSSPVATTPSGSGAHPTPCTQNAQRRLLASPSQDQPPSPITMPSNRRRRRQTHPSQRRQSRYSRVVERFLAVEERRVEVDRRNSLLFEAIANHARERDTATVQALQAIGEGLKLLAEALKNR